MMNAKHVGGFCLAVKGGQRLLPPGVFGAVVLLLLSLFSDSMASGDFIIGMIKANPGESVTNYSKLLYGHDMDGTLLQYNRDRIDFDTGKIRTDTLRVIFTRRQYEKYLAGGQHNVYRADLKPVYQNGVLSITYQKKKITAVFDADPATQIIHRIVPRVKRARFSFNTILSLCSGPGGRFETIYLDRDAVYAVITDYRNSNDQAWAKMEADAVWNLSGFFDRDNVILIFILNPYATPGCKTRGQIPWKVITDMNVASRSFENEKPINRRFTGEGEDISPQLSWENIPEGTASIAIRCHDPDAPLKGGWVHWVLYNISPDITSMKENDKNTGKKGMNSWGRTGYGGPMPPPGHGPHRYFFHVYCLDSMLDLGEGATDAQLLKAMENHILGQGMIMGTYERK